MWMSTKSDSLPYGAQRVFVAARCCSEVDAWASVTLACDFSSRFTGRCVLGDAGPHEDRNGDVAVEDPGPSCQRGGESQPGNAGEGKLGFAVASGEGAANTLGALSFWFWLLAPPNKSSGVQSADGPRLPQVVHENSGLIARRKVLLRFATGESEDDRHLLRLVVRHGFGCFWMPGAPRTSVRAFGHRFISKALRRERCSIASTARGRNEPKRRFRRMSTELRKGSSLRASGFAGLFRRRPSPITKRSGRVADWRWTIGSSTA